MKQIYLLIIGLLITGNLLSQTTVPSGTTPNGTGNNVGSQFWVENTNSYTIRLFRISMQNDVSQVPLTQTFNVWFKPNAANSAPGALTVANGWTNAGSFVHNQKFGSLFPIVSNLAIDIPAGATYRIWVSSTNVMGYSVVNPGGGVVTNTVNGVTIKSGDSISWWGGVNNTGPANQLNPLAQFVGEIEFDSLLTCSGKPQVGIITGTQGSCANETKFYYLSGYKARSGITYQWQVSTTSSTAGYVNTGTNTTMLARTHGATNEFFRCIATCGTLRDTTPVLRDTINPFYYCYCPPSAPNANPNWGSVESVEFSTTSTTNTAAVCETYTNYRGLPVAKVRAGEALNVRIKNKLCNTFSASASCWVDLNRNQVFDAGEAVPGGYILGNTSNSMQKGIQIPLTNALGITGLRVSLDANATTPPTNPCVSGWGGETEDYLVEIIRDSNDIKIDSITGLADGCDLGNTNINFKATNIGIKTMNPLVVSYSVNGGTPVTENFASLAPGATGAYTFIAQANLTGTGTKVIRVWHQNSLDTNKKNDTQMFSIVSYPTPPNLNPIDDTVCVGSDFTTFIAASNPPFMTRWYSDAAGNNEIVTGNSIVLLNPTASNIRYARSVFTVNSRVGPTAMNPSQIVWGGTGQGLTFNIMRSKVRINSVKVRFDQAGVAAIEIRNPSNTVIQTTSFLVLTANTDVTVPLNIDLPIGTNYRMILNTSSGNPFAITGFTSFPQMIPGVISITGNTNTSTPPVYNYFFDWDVTYDACSSPTVPVNSVYLAGVNAPLKTLVKDTFFCQFPTVFLDANNSGSTYKWNDGSTGRTIQVTNSGSYKVTITNAQRCRSTDSAMVAVRISPIFKIGNDTTLCGGKVLNLKSGFSNEGYNHTWNTGSLEPKIEVASPGEYFVDVFNTNTKCGYRDTILVNFVPSPNAFIGGDTFVCNSDPITVKAPSGSYTYIWDNGAITPSRTVIQNGLNKVWVEVTDVSNAYGCKSTDTINVTLASLSKPNIGNDVITCTKPYTLSVVQDPNLEYRWSNGGTTNNINVTQSNDYILTVTQVNTTCSYMDTVKVTLQSNPPLSIGDNIVTCKNDPITITANTGWTTYAWSNGFNVNKITVTPTMGTTTYTLTATGPCGSVTVSKSITYTADVPNVTLPQDQVVCAPIDLSIANPGPGYDVLWSTSENTLTITVNKTGTYWVTLSNECGSNSDAIRVIFDTIPTPNFEANWNGNFASFSNKSVNAVSYLWEFGDDSTSTDKHPTHRYKERKLYAVKLTVKNSCDSSVTITKLIDLRQKPTSIQGTSMEGIAIYPNPATDMLVVKYSNATNKLYFIELLNIDGRLIKSISTPLDVNGETKISVSDVAAGSYMLRLTDSKGSQSLQKLTILK